ncbi:bifunctional hydroxymethylpyrimidine kinase/phosphomethylpyrimidine kinase [Pedobacter sp. MC2016-14]|uniref:bifunctional hydroxymethylpyrimidine kinase/phosphomethylpyrimidine kinase n=1 Tax=Pedobacter sp. MC2016-14 TaxID=2897327 RepID=UPI001E289378|nr:bifunctional hydroxymethylpyrimidine kinase/phosphomethylpyrimidine kinase [Pedobacter sp. MC2016-14]MCD0489899.1 bifunctional hydroxymethylpyrimidine kinase/phosphomethylpyrimidine kinase [Pedobacter sp. MC2016-14]
MDNFSYPIVLSIAGSDSGGGAGIQADIKTISALGCFATTAITAVTVQNTLGLSAIHPIPVDFVKAQIKAVMDDLRPSAIKIGMVHSAELAIGIAEALNEYQHVPVVFDPVMVASSGDSLVESGTIATFKHYLFPLTQLLTPNLDEAALLAQMDIEHVEDMKNAAVKILMSGVNAVLIKGGHLKGSELIDIYRDKDGNERTFSSTAIESLNTHGTGCSLSSAIASYVALGHDMEAAIAKAKTYVHQAIYQGIDVKTGKGHGPLNHFFDPKKLVKKKNFS